MKTAQFFLRYLKEIYLTSFTVFYKLGSADWSHDTNCGKGVAGIALMGTVFLVTITGWLDVLNGKMYLTAIPKWAALTIFFAICAANYYVLVICQHGVKFESKFSDLPKRRRIFLLANFILLIVILIAFFAYSASVHRRLPKL